MAVPETVKFTTTSVRGLLLPLTRLMVIGVPNLPSLITLGSAMRSNVATEYEMIKQEASANDLLDSITMATMQNKESDGRHTQYINLPTKYSRPSHILTGLSQHSDYLIFMMQLGSNLGSVVIKLS